ncbi:MAG: Rieske 2Fe-2S domain-containing protein [Gammaproteobacteria bacterium]|nr:Rieske 2Fe-2S domain-containing protein [Gammaproteobacteria bacterium]
MVTICQLDAIPQGEGRSFTVESEDGQSHRLLVVNDNGEARGYLDRCTHFGVGLGVRSDYRYVLDGEIICQTHYARFAVDDGHCISGECAGEGLTAIALTLIDGAVICADSVLTQSG